jgi:hypothetical protein
MHRAKNIAVVGHGHGGHAELMNALDQFLDVASAVEQRVIAMQMQVDELILAHEGSWILVLGGSDSFYGWRNSRNDRKWCTSVQRTHNLNRRALHPGT